MVHLALAACTVPWIGAPYLIAGVKMAQRKLFTCYLTVSLSVLGLLFASLVGLLGNWLISSPKAGCDGTALCFDQACWVLVAWCLGQNVTGWFKGQLAHPISSLEKCLRPRGYIRISGEAGKLELVPRVLVQNGDVAVIRPGETLWCDGIAQVLKMLLILIFENLRQKQSLKSH